MDWVVTVSPSETAGGELARNPRNSPNPAKVGRNDPCFCGSGKKFKQCHGRSPWSVSA
jgi:preprotein translocase subunit SecA